MKDRRLWAGMLIGLACLLAPPVGVAQQDVPTKVFTEVSLEQKLGDWVPADVVLRDESGTPVTLRSLFRGRPVVLALVYYECPMICTEVLNGMVRSFNQLPLTLGKEYDVVTVSINPREQAPLASAKKKEYRKLLEHPGPEESWRFLTAEDSSVRRLANAIGFHYVYDEATKQYAHPTGITVLTPKGQIARYLYGVEYPPKDLKFALMEASDNTIGSAVDQVLLLCYHYDPMTGKYGLIVMNVLRVSAVVMVLALGSVIALLLVRERRHRNLVRNPPAQAHQG